jgi:uncharacterized protein YlxW (UPF0749 family)
LKIVLAIGELLLTCLVMLSIYQVFILIINAILALYSREQKMRFKRKTDAKCDEIMTKVSKTEAIIKQERENYKNLPEEYQKEFLGKYDDIEKQINNIKADVARIQYNL